MNTDDNPVVEVKGLTKVFCDFWKRPKVRAVDNLNLQIRRGEIFGLLGPNGSGKSTTIKMLLGLLHPSAGSISVLGKPPKDVAAKKLIGYLPEESYLYNYLTPRETLDFYGRLFDLNGDLRRQRVNQLLEMVGLSHAAGRRVGEFSKGMARRTGLAQALINNPELVILDEPTSGMDPIACRQVKDLLLELARSGKTIILSSHLLADVEDVCDRIAILFNGRVKAEGRVRDLLQKREIIRFALPDLNSDAVRNLVSTIRERTGKDPQVDHPSVNLERFFVEVIEQAYGEGVAPSGAVKSAGVAPFLLADGKSTKP